MPLIKEQKQISLYIGLGYSLIVVLLWPQKLKHYLISLSIVIIYLGIIYNMYIIIIVYKSVEYVFNF